MEDNRMSNTALADGYTMYRGKPLVRQGAQLCWGDLKDKYVLVLGIMTQKKVSGHDIPDQILIQILSTADKKVVRFGTKNGLFEAFEYGSAWLEQELAKN